MSGERQSSSRRKPVVGVAVLACICLVSGAGVGVLYSSMRDDIEAKRKEVFLQTLAEVLGEADSYPTVGDYEEPTPEEDKNVYMNRTDAGVLYAAMGTAQGYQSQIMVLVSLEAPAPNIPVGDSSAIHRMAVVSSQETPGLGENINAVETDLSVWAAIWAALTGTGSQAEAAPRRPRFQERFTGKYLSDLEVEKNPDTDKILPLTGATITSKAVTQAARSAVERIINKTTETYGK